MKQEQFHRDGTAELVNRYWPITKSHCQHEESASQKSRPLGEISGQTVMEVPTEIVPAVRELIAAQTSMKIGRKALELIGQVLSLSLPLASIWFSPMRSCRYSGPCNSRHQDYEACANEYFGTDGTCSHGPVRICRRWTNHNGSFGLVSSVATCYTGGAGELAHCWSRIRNTLAGP